MAERDRRVLLGAAAAGAAVASLVSLGRVRLDVRARPEGSLRPPGALDEDPFLSACIRCGRCGPVCPTGAVRFSDALSLEGGTPHMVPAERACILCMACTQACPTGALTPIAPTREAAFAQVRIGVAELDPNRCWAYSKHTICRACWYACPYPEKAIGLDGNLHPYIITEGCVGCGLCEHACPDEARAVVVHPRGAHDPHPA